MMSLIFEQLLNGVQFGVLLFLIAAGLTLIFGVMDVINLSHGSLFMFGAYFSVTAQRFTGDFFSAVVLGALGVFVLGLILERTLIRQLYARSHLDQVLATFAVILIANESAVLLWGTQPLYFGLPDSLAAHIDLPFGVSYPTYRIFVVAVGIVVGAGLYCLINHTRIGMLVRAGATNRTTVSTLGVDIMRLYMFVFALGALLAGLAGGLAGPLLSVQPGMGETILILSFVVVVIGGLGSIKGALLAALVVGVLDTLGRAFMRDLMALFLPPSAASQAGPALSSVTVYVVMALILFFRPEGLLPVQRRS